MQSNRSCVLAVLFFLAGHASADVIPPGQKSIAHFGRFENLGDYPDYVFFVAHHPARDFQRHQMKEKVEPFAIEAQRLDPADATTGLTRNPIRGGLHLLAVPKNQAERADGKALSTWFDGKTPGVLEAPIAPGYRSAPESEKRNEYWRHYQVAIKDGAMTLTPTRDDKPGDGKGPDDPTALPPADSVRWYIGGGLAAFAVALLVGWLVYFRRR